MDPKDIKKKSHQGIKGIKSQVTMDFKNSKKIKESEIN